jgi:hypothetical protein
MLSREFDRIRIQKSSRIRTHGKGPLLSGGASLLD